MEVGATEPTGLSEELGNEPPTKRLKINQLEMAHVDEVDVVQSCDLDVSMFEYEIGGDDNDLYVVTTGELADDLLWLPLTEEEPDVELSLLAQMDALADQFEVKRLLEMGVRIQSTGDEDSSNFGRSLTGKFVRRSEMVSYAGIVGPDWWPGNTTTFLLGRIHFPQLPTQWSRD